ncbi:hypothetical protein D3C73_1379190 [compost metagenome]
MRKREVQRKAYAQPWILLGVMVDAADALGMTTANNRPLTTNNDATFLFIFTNLLFH